MEEMKRLKRELVYTGTILKFYKDTIQTPKGNIVHWDFIGHNGASAVVPVLEDGRILMVKQYRNALDRIALEIPAGARDTVNEPTLECARRELEEETGYESSDLEFLISLRTAIAYCDELIDVYVAKNLKASCQQLDEDEFVEVCAYELDELIQMIYNGTIQDAKTVAALMAYKVKYGIEK